MFTGIIEEIGTIKKINKKSKSMEITIQCQKILKDTKIGDSISTNGVCLTVTNLQENTYTADIMPETYEKSNLKNQKIGDKVNLEKALTLTKPLGGHIVQGHIDTTGIIKTIEKQENATLITISYPEKYYRYIIPKGSIAIDGVSLTIAKSQKGQFTVSVIPQTKKETTLLEKALGYEINLEFDIVGKYLSHLYTIEKEENKSNITTQMLIENGFI